LKNVPGKTLEKNAHSEKNSLKNQFQKLVNIYESPKRVL